MSEYILEKAHNAAKWLQSHLRTGVFGLTGTEVWVSSEAETAKDGSIQRTCFLDVLLPDVGAAKSITVAGQLVDMADAPCYGFTVRLLPLSDSQLTIELLHDQRINRHGCSSVDRKRAELWCWKEKPAAEPETMTVAIDQAIQQLQQRLVQLHPALADVQVSSSTRLGGERSGKPAIEIRPVAMPDEQAAELARLLHPFQSKPWQGFAVWLYMPTKAFKEALLQVSQEVGTGAEATKATFEADPARGRADTARDNLATLLGNIDPRLQARVIVIKRLESTSLDFSWQLSVWLANLPEALNTRVVPLLASLEDLGWQGFKVLLDCDRPTTEAIEAFRQGHQPIKTAEPPTEIEQLIARRLVGSELRNSPAYGPAGALEDDLRARHPDLSPVWVNVAEIPDEDGKGVHLELLVQLPRKLSEELLPALIQIQSSPWQGIPVKFQGNSEFDVAYMRHQLQQAEAKRLEKMARFAEAYGKLDEHNPLLTSGQPELAELRQCISLLYEVLQHVPVQKLGPYLDTLNANGWGETGPHYEAVKHFHAFKQRIQEAIANPEPIPFTVIPPNPQANTTAPQQPTAQQAQQSLYEHLVSLDQDLRNCVVKVVLATKQDLSTSVRLTIELPELAGNVLQHVASDLAKLWRDGWMGYKVTITGDGQLPEEISEAIKQVANYREAQEAAPQTTFEVAIERAGIAAKSLQAGLRQHDPELGEVKVGAAVRGNGVALVVTVPARPDGDYASIAPRLAQLQRQGVKSGDASYSIEFRMATFKDQFELTLAIADVRRRCMAEQNPDSQGIRHTHSIYDQAIIRKTRQLHDAAKKLEEWLETAYKWIYTNRPEAQQRELQEASNWQIAIELPDTLVITPSPEWLVATANLEGLDVWFEEKGAEQVPGIKVRYNK